MKWKCMICVTSMLYKQTKPTKNPKRIKIVSPNSDWNARFLCVSVSQEFVKFLLQQLVNLTLYNFGHNMFLQVEMGFPTTNHKSKLHKIFINVI